MGISPGYRHTSDLALQWLSCLVPGGIGSALALAGLLSVYWWLGEVESLICNCYLSVAARTFVWADPSSRDTSMLLEPTTSPDLTRPLHLTQAMPTLTTPLTSGSTGLGHPIQPTLLHCWSWIFLSTTCKLKALRQQSTVFDFLADIWPVNSQWWSAAFCYMFGWLVSRHWHLSLPQ